MASCELTIQLTEPEAIFHGGDAIHGHVIVRVDKNVTCNGLKVSTGWETHGKGNVDRKTVEETVVFHGKWSAGESHRYDFTLPCASWPPTYHGHHLNIDHFVYAQADIPWAFDPKTKYPIRVVSLQADPLDPQKEADSTELSGAIVSVIFGLVALAFVAVAAVMALFNPFFSVIVFGFMALVGVWWLFTSFLPNWKLGSVRHRLETDVAHPGDSVHANLRVHPRSSVRINGVEWTIKAEEVVVRGSGTDRKTYRHEVASHRVRASGPTRLDARRDHNFALVFPLPDDSPYSIDLDDNDLRWTVKVRIDIPNWPDWNGEEALLVRPRVDASERQARRAPEAANDSEPAAESTRFTDVIGLVARARGDMDNLERILEGVADIEFDVQAKLERRISVGRIDPRIGYEDGIVVMAAHPDPHLPLLLYASSSTAAQLDAYYGRVWQGRGTIVGYDRRIGNLEIRISENERRK